jgi:hypothetical protein
MHQEDGTLGVATVGPGFMGAAHSQGWGTAPRVFDLRLQPVMKVLCGRNGEATHAAAAKHPGSRRRQREQRVSLDGRHRRHSPGTAGSSGRRAEVPR